MPVPEEEQLDLGDSELDDEYERMRDLLHAQITDFADEHQVPIGALSPLLLDLAATTRMTDYAISVEKPSTSGLKLELDRMHRDVDDLVRQCKRGADEFIARVKDELRAADAEIEAEGGAQAEQETEPKR
jgi:hypothetical protein